MDLEELQKALEVQRSSRALWRRAVEDLTQGTREELYRGLQISCRGLNMSCRRVVEELQRALKELYRLESSRRVVEQLQRAREELQWAPDELQNNCRLQRAVQGSIGAVERSRALEKLQKAQDELKSNCKGTIQTVEKLQRAQKDLQSALQELYMYRVLAELHMQRTIQDQITCRVAVQGSTRRAAECSRGEQQRI